MRTPNGASPLAVATAILSVAPLAVRAILVSPGSPCDQYCGNVLSATTGADMTCDEASYTGTSAGIVFESCVNCLSTSTYSTGNQSDLQWLLYNLRFNMAWCLWGDPGNKDVGSNPCITTTACGPLLHAVEYNNLTTHVGGLDYCQDWIEPQVPKCSACLTAMQNGHYLNNYLTMLDAACTQRPGNGSTISVQGSPFSTTPVVITTPSPTFASVPMPDYGPVSLGARVGIAFGALAFILAVVGFCIVCIGRRRRRAYLREMERRKGQGGWPHPKTRYGGGSGQDMFETPVSQKPLRGWDESPVSAHTEIGGPERNLPLPRYFSPYSSTYNSPVSASDGASSSASGVNWPSLQPQRMDTIVQEQSPMSMSQGSTSTPPPAFSQWPSPTQEKLLMQMHHERRQNEIAIGLALGGDEASLRSKNSNPNMMDYNQNGYPVDKKGKGADRSEMYEMHEVESPYSSGGNAPQQQQQQQQQYKMPAEPEAPVLHHPGYGRLHHNGSRPSTGGTGNGNGNGMAVYDEEEMRRGNFV